MIEIRCHDLGSFARKKRWPSSRKRRSEVVDVAKITCDQFLAGRVGDFTSMSFWLSGYYHGRRDNTVVDVSAMQKQIHNVLDYCLSHSDVLVMDAVKKVLDAAK